ncbi:MAG: zinc dependent phospholipase C family protein [Bacilli bacterium]|nr:zinc dependent phospholipase C family protein [Bacilli bacterium]
MPAFFTHYTFVEKNTGHEDPYASIRALGGQGPDVFFFYGYSLRKRENKSQKRYFGTHIHHINISDAYSFLLEYANKQEDKEMLNSYLKGLFMHYVMDRNCHPYIFYRTGFATDPENKEEAKKYMNIHVRFESILDTVYAKSNKTFIKPKKCVKSNENWVKSVSKMFFELAKHLNYEYVDELTFYNAYKDMLFVESVLYSPLGVKKFFANLFIKNNFINCMMSPARSKPYEKYDVTNLSNSEWKDCITGEIRKESFLELVENAKKELPKVDELIKKASLNEDIKEDMVNFIHNIDHDGFMVNATKSHYQNFLDTSDTK